MKDESSLSITDLNVDVKGITLNMQQIDLLSIVSCNSGASIDI